MRFDPAEVNNFRRRKEFIGVNESLKYELHELSRDIIG